MHNLMKTGIESKAPFSIRYPKGSSIQYDDDFSPSLIKIGQWERINDGENIAVLAVGSMVEFGAVHESTVTVVHPSHSDSHRLIFTQGQVRRPRSALDFRERR